MRKVWWQKSLNNILLNCLFGCGSKLPRLNPSNIRMLFSSSVYNELNWSLQIRIFNSKLSFVGSEDILHRINIMFKIELWILSFSNQHYYCYKTWLRQQASMYCMVHLGIHTSSSCWCILRAWFRIVVIAIKTSEIWIVSSCWIPRCSCLES